MPDPLSLSAREAAREIAAGRLRAEALIAGLPRTDRRARADDRRLAVSRSARRRSKTARRCDASAAERAAARHPDRGQGSDRHGRHADRIRLGDLCRPSPRRRRRLRRAGARRRRDRARQDRHDRIRLLHAGQDRQPAQPGAHARRLVERLGRRGGRRHGAARLRHADRRLGDPPGRVLRRRRLQAELRHDPARRRQDAVPTASTRSATMARNVADAAFFAGVVAGRPALRDIAPCRQRRRVSAFTARRCGTRPSPTTAAALDRARAALERAGAARRRRSRCRPSTAPDRGAADRSWGSSWCAASPMSGCSTAPNCRRRSAQLLDAGLAVGAAEYDAAHRRDRGGARPARRVFRRRATRC